MDDVVMDALEASFEAVEKAGLPPVRPMLAGGRPSGSAAFEGFLRSGGGALEMKALSRGERRGGRLCGARGDRRRIDATLKAISPIRSIANVVKVGSSGYRKLVTTGGTPSGWAAETAARTETATPVFNEVAPPIGDLYANPAASQAMLDDAAFDVEEWLAQRDRARIRARPRARRSSTATASTSPRASWPRRPRRRATSTRAFGTLQYLASGAAGASRRTREDKLIDLVQSAARAVPAGRGVGDELGATLARIRKFKTGDGAFLWQPGLAAGQPATLLGYPVVEAEDMPDIAANALSIAFGNFKAGYLIAERSETQILRDPYTNKPFVHFYATKRVGGMVSNSEAIKLLKFAAS